MAKLTKEYKDNWARSKGYEDFADYQRKYVQKRKEHLREYKIQWRKNKGFKREVDYRNQLAIDADYKTYAEMQKARRLEKTGSTKPEIPKGFKIRKDYLEDLAIRQGYHSYSKKRKSNSNNESDPEKIERRARKMQRNLELSHLITQGVYELGQTYEWLANQAGVTKQAVSLYAHAKVYPKKEVLDKIYSALGNKFVEFLRK